jgi:2'-hydroxyisoflavone reductase
MRLLVLGGTHHVGRALVEAGLERGDEVTTLNRGTRRPARGVDARFADRRDPDALAQALGNDVWDAVVDTWSHEPAAVSEAALQLSGRAAHLTYISSRSVYAWPIPSGADESAPLVTGDPASTDAEPYAEAKRGGEMAAKREFGGPVLLARAGLVLGPYEIVGRLPWWLRRIAAGGPVPAPGPPDRPLQYIDGRDLAEWVLRCAERRRAGAFNTVSKPGHTTIGEVLQACVEVTRSGAELVWRTPEQVGAAGVSGWTDLPIWTPPTGELAALHDADVDAAHGAGLTCRPVAETVRETWDWLQAEGWPEPPPGRAGQLGTTAAQEALLLAG